MDVTVTVNVRAFGVGVQILISYLDSFFYERCEVTCR